MKIETLIVTIDQHDFSLIEKMNIQTDAVVGNQSNYNEVNSIDYNGSTVTYYSTTDRGVGLNRNLVLDKSSADICVFADDDMCFVDDYPSVVEKAIAAAPDADIWIFNLIEKHPRRYVNNQVTDINRTNYARYGAARIVVRRESLINAGIRFNLLFGGGACYGSGEDTIFLKECLNKKLKLMAVPYSLAEIDEGADSTWFSGYNYKFFFDKGALYAALSPRGAVFYCIRYALKYKNKYKSEFSPVKAYIAMLRGIEDYKNKFTSCCENL